MCFFQLKIGIVGQTGLGILAENSENQRKADVRWQELWPKTFPWLWDWAVWIMHFLLLSCLDKHIVTSKKADWYRNRPEHVTSWAMADVPDLEGKLGLSLVFSLTYVESWCKPGTHEWPHCNQEYLFQYWVWLLAPYAWQNFGCGSRLSCFTENFNFLFGAVTDSPCFGSAPCWK